MALYASVAELASYLKIDPIDTATATLVLTVASGTFARAADTAFSATTTTYTDTVDGSTDVVLPYRPVTAVSAVRINGVAITGWVLRVGVLYRTAGFGSSYAFPPDELAVDLTYGYATVPDDVKGAVLDMAAQAYDVPNSAVASESVDDYAVRYVNGGGLQLTASAAAVAAGYRGVLIA